MNRLPLSALLLSLVATAYSTTVGISAPSRGPLAAALGAHLAAVPGERPDAGALLAAVQAKVGSPDSSVEERVAAAALIGAMTSADKSSTLEAYFGGEQPQLSGKLDLVFAAVQSDPVQLKRWMTALKTLPPTLSAAGELDVAALSAIWDGGAGKMPVPTIDADRSGRADAPRLDPFQPAPALQKTVVPAPAISGLKLGKPAAAAAVAPKATNRPASGLTADEERRAVEYVDALLRLDPMDFQQAKQGHGAAESYGAKLQAEAAAQSRMLQKPLTKTSLRGSSTGDVGQALTALQEPMAALDPSRVSFDPSRFMRFLIGLNPWGKLPAEQYAEDFANSKVAIETIAKSLEASREGLLADIESLREDQARMRDIIRKLTHSVNTARYIDNELDRRVAAGELASEHAQFIVNEISFPLKQRILDLQQQLAVNQQGVVAAQIVIENNQTLARSVSRTINTIPAVLQVAALIANGLEGQREVLDAVSATNLTGAAALQNAARQAKEQGRALQDQASASMLPVERLKAAYKDLSEALGDISKFKAEKLPQMTAQIAEFDDLTRQGEGALQRIENAISAKEGPKP